MEKVWGKNLKNLGGTKVEVEDLCFGEADGEDWGT